MIRILIIEPSPANRGLLRQLLLQLTEIYIIGDAKTANTAIINYPKSEPTLILLGLKLTDYSELKEIAKLRYSFPQAKIVVISNYPATDNYYSAVENGAAAALYFPKEIPLLASTIQSVSKPSAISKLSSNNIQNSKVDTQLNFKQLENVNHNNRIIYIRVHEKHYLEDPGDKELRKMVNKYFGGFIKHPNLLVSVYPYIGNIILLEFVMNSPKEILVYKLNSINTYRSKINKIKIIPTIIRDYIEGELLLEKELRWEEAEEVEQFHKKNKTRERLLESAQALQAERNNDVEKQKNEKAVDARAIGYVYLLKSGKYFKIGKANVVDKRIYQLKQALPEEPILIHTIETSDPIGIEHYWHHRFSKYRKGGEFFELPEEAVNEFKRHTQVL